MDADNVKIALVGAIIFGVAALYLGYVELSGVALGGVIGLLVPSPLAVQNGDN